MNPRYCCVCYAIPPKLRAHLVKRHGAANPAEPAHELLAAKLRSGRLAKPAPHLPDQPDGPSHQWIFDAGHTEHLPGKVVWQEGDSAGADQSVNQVQKNVDITLRFFREVFNRHAIDGHGGRVDSSVHVSKRMGNALWTGHELAFGDGDDFAGGFTGCLDIIAHEFTHGITQHLIPGGLGATKTKAGDDGYPIAELKLVGEPGALNESISDVFGSMVKQWKEDRLAAEADWLVGKGILLGHGNHAVRSLKAPGDKTVTCTEDRQIRHTSEFKEGLDVHDLAGVPSHAFYLAAIALKGKSWETLGPIWYQALQGLHPQSRFDDFARVTLKAAKALHPAGGPHVQALTDAWQAVGVKL